MRSLSGFYIFQGPCRRTSHVPCQNFHVLAAPHRIRNKAEVQVLTVSMFTLPRYGIACSSGRVFWDLMDGWHEEEFRNLHIFVFISCILRI